MNAKQLIEEARKVLGEYSLKSEGAYAGSVAAALLTEDGNIYTGISIDVHCSIGFCSEHAAIAEMLKHRETRIKKIVAVFEDKIVPPCGRCREFMYQVNSDNLKTEVYVSEDEYHLLDGLLPVRWEG